MGREFVLKDSPQELIEATGAQPKGRTYDSSYSGEPGAIRIDDVVEGMKYASLAITDDEEGTLAKVGKANPWHIEALTMITGSEEEAHKPLSHILPTHVGLNLDKIIDITGRTPGGHFLDTQGYIAHSDTEIVLAYRCTTSVFDWLTNLNTTHSDWEIDEDAVKGFSGHFSGLEGLCCVGEYKPRVHTGFYNNFLATLPAIREHIEPLLQPDQPPRKLYVVGHSLGAGIATLAACYFLLDSIDWAESPHKFMCVTAGSPRAVQQSMKEKIDEKMQILKPLDKAVICRLVLDRDVVATVPPAMFGFKHLDKLVYITDNGEILINPEVDDAIDENEKEEIMKNNPMAATEEDNDSDDDDTYTSKYEKLVSKIPKPFRDHMPDFYLSPLIKTFEKEHGIVREEKTQVQEDAQEEAEDEQQQEAERAATEEEEDPQGETPEEQEEDGKGEQEDHKDEDKSVKSKRSFNLFKAFKKDDDKKSTDSASNVKTIEEQPSTDSSSSKSSSSSSSSSEAETAEVSKKSSKKKSIVKRLFSRSKKSKEELVEEAA